MGFEQFIVFVPQMSGIWDASLSLFMLSLAIMVLIIALAYMASQFLKKPEYENFASLEIYQVFVSVLLFISIGGIAIFSNSITEAFAGSDPVEIGRSYLAYVSEKIALPTMMSFETLKLTMQFVGSISARWGASVWGAVLLPFGGCSVVEKAADVVLMISVPFIASLQAQMILLEGIDGLALPFVLPAGALLRLFPPTRDAGTFMMCSALAALTVYPFTYVICDRIVHVMVSHETEREDITDSLRVQGFGSFADMMSAKGVFHPEKMIFRPIRMLSFVVLQGAFLPALSMTLTIAFIKGTTKFVSQKFG